MYRRILVPLDGSTLSEVALAQLPHLAGSETEVLLVRVVDPARPDPPPFAFGPYPPGGGSTIAVPPSLNQGDAVPEGAQVREQSQSYLDERAEVLGPTVAKRRTLVVEGADPGEAIARQASEESADLIVMATHGRSGVVRWILGSVAEKVLHSTRVPLLLVRPGQPVE